MSVIYRERDVVRERERDWDDTRTSVSRRGEGGYTTVKRYRINGDEDTRSSRYEAERPARVEETRIVRREREPEPRAERDIVIRREWEEPPRERERERDVVIRRERVEEEPPRREMTIVSRREEPPPVQERDLVIRRTIDRDREEPRYERESRIERYDDRERDTYDRNYDLAPPRDLQRYSRSTEYFSQPQQPQTIIIRQEPIIIRERIREPPENDYALIRREDADDRSVATTRKTTRPDSPPSPREEEEYFYQRRVRETEGGRGRDRSEDMYEREDRYRRDVSPGDSISQVGRRGRDRDAYSSDDSMVYVRKEVRETSRDRSESPNHRRHVAEGALAGIGAAELLRRHNKKSGKETGGPLARAGKDLGAGILGIVAAEGVSRARSRYRSKSRRRSRSDSRDSRGSRSRRRSRSQSQSRIKKGAAIGLGAAALAIAAAVAKNRNKSPEAGGRRSRSRRRRASVDDSEPIDDARNPSHRNKRMAEAGLAGAAVAGLIERARSKSRKGDDRSQSKLRTSLPIAAAGLGSAAIAGLYEKNKAKKEAAMADVERKSRSRSRSRARSNYDGSRGTNNGDPMIEYGTDPVYGAIPQQGYYGQPAADNYYDNAVVPAAAGAAGYGAARGERSRSRSRSRDRRRSDSTSSSDGGRRRRHRRHRSRSQSQDLATAGVAAAGGAMAANEYEQRKARKHAEKEARRQARRQRREAEQQSHDAYEETYDPTPNTYNPPDQQFYPQNNSFPPPPGAVPQEFSQQQTYNPATYQAPANAAPQAGQAYNQGFAANPAVDEYGRPRRGDENV